MAEVAAKATLALLATAACAGVVTFPALAGAQADAGGAPAEPSAALVVEPTPAVVVEPAAGAVEPTDVGAHASTRLTAAPAPSAPAGAEAAEAATPVAESETEPAEVVPPTVALPCWLGGERPIFVLRNADPVRSMRYAMRAAGQSRQGGLGPAGSATDRAWFVGAGTFPTATPVEVRYELGGRAGQVSSTGAGSRFCTYDVAPVVEWVDEEGAAIEPSAADLAGWQLTLESALETLTCGWTPPGGLRCASAARTDAPFPLRATSGSGAGGSLQVPAFGDTSYTVRSEGLPSGYEVAGGDGATVLDDVAAGLDQVTVDAQAAFFQAQLSGGGAARTAALTVRRIPEAIVPPDAVTVANDGATTTPRTLRLGSGVAASTPWSWPSLSPSPSSTTPAATAAGTTSGSRSGSAWEGAVLPETGTDAPPVLAAAGAAVLALGLAARRVARSARN
jgi:LPXTG-motif cell wall-anchored protein